MTIFEMIIEGDIPGNFVYSDDKCVVFATIEPVRPGHVLVVPREPVDAWTDLSDEDAAHLMNVAKIIGNAQKEAFKVPRIGLSILGFEVPHTHLHVVPLRSEGDMSPANATKPSVQELVRDMELLRGALVKLGYGDNVPSNIASPVLD
ncbi:MAG: HIT family protein [Actinomycetaceae bacterium]|nr:HIT family protein [Actinomycetaceae bacterium]